jgi:hypothetical protein
MPDYYIWTGNGKLFIFREIYLDPEEDQTIAFEDWYLDNDIENMYTHCSVNDMDWGEVEEPTAEVITPVLPWKTKQPETDSNNDEESDSNSDSD